MSIFKKWFSSDEEEKKVQQEVSQEESSSDEGGRVLWSKEDDDKAAEQEGRILWTKDEGTVSELKEEEEALVETATETEPVIEIEEEVSPPVLPEAVVPEPTPQPEPEPEPTPEPEPEPEAPKPIVEEVKAPVAAPTPEPESIVEPPKPEPTPTPAPVVDESKAEAEPEAKDEKKEESGMFGKWFGGKPKTDEERKEDLNVGLKKSSDGIFTRLSKAVAGRTEVDMDVLDDIEEALVASDISVDTSIKIIERLEARVARDKYLSVNEVYSMLKEEIMDLLTENNTPDYNGFEIPETPPGVPYVMMVVGVNGVGKTTTIGKLAHQFKIQGKSVMLGAADTFRAAAVDQLIIWGQRVDVPVIHQEMGSDPASVAFDTVQAAVARNADVVIIDTAGRLHNKKHLMDELSKIKRVMNKVKPDLPHDVMLVLDGSTGQNAIHQAEQFTKATEVTCIAVTKLDGTAKGGAVIGISDQFSIPIKYIGVGEGMHHLQVFNKEDFVNSLFAK